MKTVFCNKKTIGTKTDAYWRDNKGALTASGALFPFFGSLSFVQKDIILRRIAQVCRVVQTEKGVTPLALLQGKRTVYSACVDSVKCAASTRTRRTHTHARARRGGRKYLRWIRGSSNTRGVH